MGIYTLFYYGVKVDNIPDALRKKIEKYKKYCYSEHEKAIQIIDSHYGHGLWAFRVENENKIIVLETLYDENDEKKIISRGEHEISQTSIDEFKQFLIANGITEPPKWSVECSDTLGI